MVTVIFFKLKWIKVGKRNMYPENKSKARQEEQQRKKANEKQKRIINVNWHKFLKKYRTKCPSQKPTIWLSKSLTPDYYYYFSSIQIPNNKQIIYNSTRHDMTQTQTHTEREPSTLNPKHEYFTWCDLHFIINC